MKKLSSVLIFAFLVTQFNFAQEFAFETDDLASQDKNLYYEALEEEVNLNKIEVDEEDQKALNSKEIKMKAIKDAQNNYQGKNSGAVWTGIATAITSPILGFIPAATTTNAAPKNQNLRINDSDLQEDYDYYTTYRKEAHAIKKKRNWTAYGIGSAVWFVLALVFY